MGAEPIIEVSWRILIDSNTHEAPPYSFDQLVGEFKTLLNFLPDIRRLNKSYRISDAALSIDR